MERGTGMKRGVGLLTVSLWALGACGAYQGSWPRLAPNDASDVAFQQEGALEEATNAQDNNPPIPAEATPADVEAFKALNARIIQARTAFNALAQRYDMQKQLVEDARNNTNGARLGPSSSEWATTQLELTRLGQITREMASVRGDAAQITADIAAYAARGVDAKETLAIIGRLISRIDATLQAADLYRKEVSMSLSDTPRP